MKTYTVNVAYEELLGERRENRTEERTKVRAHTLSFEFKAERTGPAEQQGGEVGGQIPHHDNAVNTKSSTI